MSETTYEIHPKIGVARLGNSKKFYLAPKEIGGIPLEYDTKEYVTAYKDDTGKVKRQAAKFTIYKHGPNSEVEKVSSKTKDVDKIEWIVHIANKKAAWYTFSELQGNREFGEYNSYKKQHIGLNNSKITDKEKRRALIIDPGYQKIDSKKRQKVEFSRFNVRDDYKKCSFPDVNLGGQQIDTLGELQMDEQDSLLVLGGYGKVTGDANIKSFKGADGYWDDIADGYVKAIITLADGTTITSVKPSWVIVGSPKYAPELVNISTLYDTIYDTAIRHHSANKEIYNENKPLIEDPSNNDSSSYSPLKHFNTGEKGYKVNIKKQVQPIFDRMENYKWVANIPYLSEFKNLDLYSDDLDYRKKIFKLFRVPVLPEDYKESIKKVENGPNRLCNDEGLPLLPLNSGDNSVTNFGPIYKFETLKATQYFFLHQWSIGAALSKKQEEEIIANKMDDIDQADIGNCVGAPFSPGIEVTWSVRSKNIYDDASMRLKVSDTDYSQHGLDPMRDETKDGSEGCEPGDLTKRMAVPWQADFNQCTVQTPHIYNPNINQVADGTGISVPPVYYVYWWPPQSPMHVMTGSLDPKDQVLDAAFIKNGDSIVAAGRGVDFHRGVDNTKKIIDNWYNLGFIINKSKNEHILYFVEKERNHANLVQYDIVQHSDV